MEVNNAVTNAVRTMKEIQREHFVINDGTNTMVLIRYKYYGLLLFYELV